MLSLRKLASFAVCSSLALFCFSGTLSAQQVFGSIVGTVTDPSGAGELCKVLRLALAVEAADWDALCQCELASDAWGECYLNALKYEEDLRSQMSAVAA